MVIEQHEHRIKSDKCQWRPMARDEARYTDELATDCGALVILPVELVLVLLYDRAGYCTSAVKEICPNCGRGVEVVLGEPKPQTRIITERRKQ